MILLLFEQFLTPFAIGYQKAVKQLLGLSSHVGSHYACQNYKLLMFNHLLNKAKISAALSYLSKLCYLIEELVNYLNISSVMVREVNTVPDKQYQMDFLLETD